MKNRIWLATASIIPLAAIVYRVAGINASPQVEALVFGISIVGAAFLLSWAAEVAQMDISQSLALAFLALIAVLPEYSVDLYFAWTAGKDPAYAHYAIANMTGANRLLIGFGWALVLFLFWFKTRKTSLVLEKSHNSELFFLGLATLWALTIPLKGQLNLIDAAVLLAIFGLYMWTSSRAKMVEPDLVGPGRIIGSLSKHWRRAVVLFLFLFSAGVIFISAEPFAEGLLEIGESFGIDKFLLVQWVAPLASEAPEIAIASIFALQGMAGASMGMLISSKVNQWTLLVGALPIAYSISSGGITGMPLDSRQAEEVLLTAAQSAFAIVLLARLRFPLGGAVALFVLFGTQLFFTDPKVRYGFSAAYLGLTAFLLLRDSKRRNALRSMPSYVWNLARTPAKRN